MPEGSVLEEVLTPMKGDSFMFPVADGTVKISGGDRRLRTSTSIPDRPERGEEQEILQAESGGLSSPSPHQDDSTQDDAVATNDFWSITGDFIHRHHVEPRVKLHMPKEQSFPIPLKYIDVTRRTHTFDVQQLRGLVSQLQAQIETLRQNPSRDNQPEGPVLKRQCGREDFVPQCHEEMEEWMAGRHADLQTAMVSGQLPEVARISQLMTKAAQEWRQVLHEQIAAPSLVANTVR